MSLSFEKLKEINDRRNQLFFECHDWTLTDWGCAIAGEVGETCNKLKKRRRGEIVSLEEIGDEIADVVLYADLLATKLGLDLGECVKRKFNIVSDRVGADIKLE